MTDSNGRTSAFGDGDQAFELCDDRFGVGVVIEEDVAFGIGDAVLVRHLLRHAAFRGAAIDKEQLRMGLDQFHQPLHVTGMLREQTAHVVVDADHIRHSSEVFLNGVQELGVCHVQGNAAGTERIALRRLHG